MDPIGYQGIMGHLIFDIKLGENFKAIGMAVVPGVIGDWEFYLRAVDRRGVGCCCVSVGIVDIIGIFL